MWKIQKRADRNRVVLGLSGRITGEELEDLQSALAAESENKEVALDLKDVKLVDQDVVTFLARREAAGVKLRNCPKYIREWIARERKRRYGFRLIKGLEKTS